MMLIYLIFLLGPSFVFAAQCEGLQKNGLEATTKFIQKIARRRRAHDNIDRTNIWFDYRGSIDATVFLYERNRYIRDPQYRVFRELREDYGHIKYIGCSGTFWKV
jgi:hypothetical protein